MKLIFIRHGDPDYVNDSLTEKGVREAKLLADRVAGWENVTDYYISPLGRAQRTAEYSLNKINRTGITLNWLQEFYVPVKDPYTGKERTPWDYMPEFWRNTPDFFDKDRWFEPGLYKESAIYEKYLEVTGGLDEVLAKYGYTRDKNLYRVDHENDDTTLVFFCHLGVSYVCLSHLLGISPVLLWHTFFTAPTSVTIVGCEERMPGIASFRVQVVGDTKHLDVGGEPISKSGYYTDTFQK